MYWRLGVFLISGKTPWFSTEQSLENLPEVFLSGEPNAKTKKNSYRKIAI